MTMKDLKSRDITIVVSSFFALICVLYLTFTPAIAILFPVAFIALVGFTINSSFNGNVQMLDNVKHAYMRAYRLARSSLTTAKSTAFLRSADAVSFLRKYEEHKTTNKPPLDELLKTFATPEFPELARKIIAINPEADFVRRHMLYAAYDPKFPQMERYLTHAINDNNAINAAKFSDGCERVASGALSIIDHMNAFYKRWQVLPRISILSSILYTNSTRHRIAHIIALIDSCFPERHDEILDTIKRNWDDVKTALDFIASAPVVASALGHDVEPNDPEFKPMEPLTEIPQAEIEDEILDFSKGVDSLIDKSSPSTARWLEENIDTVRFCAIAICALSAVTGFSALMQVKMFKDFQKNVVGLGAMLTGGKKTFECLKDAADSFLPLLYNWFGATYVTSEERTVAASLAAINKLHRDVIQFTIDIQADVMGLARENDPQQFQIRYDQLIKQVSQISDTKRSLYNFHHILDRTASAINYMIEIRRDLLKQAGGKQAPVVIYVASEQAGIGKSYSVEMLARRLAKHYGGSIYTRTMEDKYWSNYASQTVCVLQDFGQFKDDEDHKILHSYATTDARDVIKAEIEGKGRPFTSRFLLMSSNKTWITTSKTINSLDALNRRRDFTLYMRNDSAVAYKQEHKVPPPPQHFTERPSTLTWVASNFGETANLESPPATRHAEWKIAPTNLDEVFKMAIEKEKEYSNDFITRLHMAGYFAKSGKQAPPLQKIDRSVFTPKTVTSGSFLPRSMPPLEGDETSDEEPQASFYPIVSSTVAKQFPYGLIGPPGIGKTWLVKSGLPERNIYEVKYDDLEQYPTNKVIFFDDVSRFPKRWIKFTEFVQDFHEGKIYAPLAIFTANPTSGFFQHVPPMEKEMTFRRCRTFNLSIRYRWITNPFLSWALYVNPLATLEKMDTAWHSWFLRVKQNFEIPRCAPRKYVEIPNMFAQLLEDSAAGAVAQAERCEYMEHLSMPIPANTEYFIYIPNTFADIAQDVLGALKKARFLTAQGKTPGQLDRVRLAQLLQPFAAGDRNGGSPETFVRGFNLSRHKGQFPTCIIASLDERIGFASYDGEAYAFLVEPYQKVLIADTAIQCGGIVFEPSDSNLRYHAMIQSVSSNMELSSLTLYKKLDAYVKKEDRIGLEEQAIMLNELRDQPWMVALKATIEFLHIAIRIGASVSLLIPPGEDLPEEEDDEEEEGAKKNAARQRAKAKAKPPPKKNPTNVNDDLTSGGKRRPPQEPVKCRCDNVKNWRDPNEQPQAELPEGFSRIEPYEGCLVYSTRYGYGIITDGRVYAIINDGAGKWKSIVSPLNSAWIPCSFIGEEMMVKGPTGESKIALSRISISAAYVVSAACKGFTARTDVNSIFAMTMCFGLPIDMRARRFEPNTWNHISKTIGVEVPKQITGKLEQIFPHYTFMDLSGEKPEGCIDVVAYEDVSRLTPSMVNIVTADGKLVCQGFMVKGRCGITVAHIAESDSLYARGTRGTFKITFLRTIPERDIALFQLERQAPQFPDITGSFIRAEDLSKIFSTSRATPALFFNADHRNGQSLVNIQQTTVYRRLVSRFVDDGTYAQQLKDLGACGLTKLGDCGSILLIMNRAVQKKIFGLHRAGSPTTSVFAFVTQEALHQLMDERSEAIPVMRPRGEEQIPCPWVIPGGKPRFQSELKFVGKSTFKQIIPTKTAKYSTGIKTPAASYEPSVTSHDDPRIQPGRSFIREALQRYDAPPIDPSLKVRINEGFEEIGNYIATKMEQQHMDSFVLTTTEAINGNNYASSGLNAIDRTGSAGFPYNPMFGLSSKNDYLEFKDNRWKLADTEAGRLVQNDLNHIILKASNGQYEVMPFVAYPKDECVALKKIYDVGAKTRCFFSGNFAYHLAYRKYFGSVLSRITELHHVLPIKIGINPMSDEWEQLFFYLARCGTKGWCVDAKFWDSHMPTEFVSGVVKVYDIIHKRTDPTWSPEQDIIRKMIHKNVENAHVVLDDDVYQLRCGQISGFPGTAGENSLQHWNLAYLVFCDLATANGHSHLANFKAFMENVSAAWYGDDATYVVKPACHTFFGQQDFIRGARRYGFEFVDSDKTGITSNEFRDIFELDFLKRHFVEHDGRILGKLDLNSIGKSIEWITSTPSYSVKKYYPNWPVSQEVAKIADSIAPSWTELAIHGEEVYDTWRAQVTRETNRLGIETNPPLWRSALRHIEGF